MLSITNDDFILFIVTMIFVGIGVFGKDYSNTLSKKDRTIKFFRMVFVMTTISSLMLAVKDIFSRFNIFFYFFICITAGWMNYSLPKFLDDIGESLIARARRFFVRVFGSDQTDYEKLVEEMEKIKVSNETIIHNQESIQAGIAKSIHPEELTEE